MPADDALPSVPEADLAAGGWERVETQSTVRLRLPTAQVREHTVVYEDAELAARVAEATGEDGPALRFFFATALAFDPPLAPGIGPASLFPTVAAEARRAFADDLTDRGVRDVSRTRRERTRVDTGDRARLTGYRGGLPVGDATLDVAGWVGVWTHDGQFRLAGGGYPETPLDRTLGVETPGPTAYRDELLDLMGGVS